MGVFSLATLIVGRLNAAGDHAAALEACRRYLELYPPRDADTVLVDFNYAKNPYCAYEDGWACPLVPEINRTAARLAREAADTATAATPDKPRFVAGVLGHSQAVIADAVAAGRLSASCC